MSSYGKTSDESTESNDISSHQKHVSLDNPFQPDSKTTPNLYQEDNFRYLPDDNFRY